MQIFSRSIAALAALGLGAPAAAQNLYGQGASVDVSIEVEKIAVLEVVKAEGSMIVDDALGSGDTMGQNRLMGRTSSGPGIEPFDGADADYAELRLKTNFTLDHVLFTFLDGEQQPGIDGRDNFGLAVRDGGSVADPDDVLGVVPQACFVTSGSGGPSLSCMGATSPGEIVRDTGFPDSDIPNGVYDFALGVRANWTYTPSNSANQFAAPGTYTLPIEATIVP